LSLADEIHQRKPFPSIQDEALISVFVTSDLLSRTFQKVLRVRGLSIPQYNILRILRGAGVDGLPLMTIGRRMIVRYPNVTRLTDRLETIGWIRRERSTKDRRVVRAFVTQAGLDLLQPLDDEIFHATQHVMRGAGVADLRTLIAILESVRGPLRADGKLAATTAGSVAPPTPRRARP
jgi:DNA-binding MarR family transcriptional regulator